MTRHISSNSSEDRDLCCRYCQRRRTDGVWLWDRNYYCSDCVRAKSPLLMEQAKKGHAFRETAPYTAKDLVKGELRILGYVVAWAYAVVAMGITAGGAPPSSYFGGLAVVAILSLIVGAPMSAMRVLLAVRLKPTVIAADGRIQVRRGETTDAIVEVGACRWTVGRAHRDTGLGKHITGWRRSVVVVEFRTGSGRLQRAACGWTRATKEIWIAFLTLSAVRK